jgi:hypothetical protein
MRTVRQARLEQPSIRGKPPRGGSACPIFNETARRARRWPYGAINPNPRRSPMIKHTSLALAAAVLLAGASVASAATMSSTTPHDTLSLSSTQQKTAWHDLYMKSLSQKGPSGFTAKVGEALPSSITTAPVNSKAASDVPALKPYNFAMLQSKLVIVNPKDHKIADVITR